MQCSYHPDYQIALPPGHPFPISKYPLLKERLLSEGVLAATDLLEPAPIEMTSIELVHTPEYLEKLQSSGLSSAEQRRLGLPWSEMAKSVIALMPLPINSSILFSNFGWLGLVSNRSVKRIKSVRAGVCMKRSQ